MPGFSISGVRVWFNNLRAGYSGRYTQIHLGFGQAVHIQSAFWGRTTRQIIGLPAFPKVRGLAEIYGFPNIQLMKAPARQPMDQENTRLDFTASNENNSLTLCIPPALLKNRCLRLQEALLELPENRLFLGRLKMAEEKIIDSPRLIVARGFARPVVEMLFQKREALSVLPWPDGFSQIAIIFGMKQLLAQGTESGRRILYCFLDGRVASPDNVMNLIFNLMD